MPLRSQLRERPPSRILRAQEIDFGTPQLLRQKCDGIQRNVWGIDLDMPYSREPQVGGPGEHPLRQPGRFPYLTQVTRQRASDLSRFAMRRGLSRRTANPLRAHIARRTVGIYAWPCRGEPSRDGFGAFRILTAMHRLVAAAAAHLPDGAGHG